MIGNRRVVAVLTVSDNSKRLPGKTYADFGGTTLLQHTINKIVQCPYIDELLIDSPDDDLKVDVKKVLFVRSIRPKDLAGDSIPILPVLQQAVRSVEEELDIGYRDFIVWVDFTKPLTPLETLNKCIEVAYGNDYDSVATVKPVRGNLLGDEAICSQMKPEAERKYLYWGAVRLRTWFTLETAGRGTWGYGERHKDLPIINDWEVDVDYPHDLVQARAILKWLEEDR